VAHTWCTKLLFKKKKSLNISPRHSLGVRNTFHVERYKERCTRADPDKCDNKIRVSYRLFGITTEQIDLTVWALLFFFKLPSGKGLFTQGSKKRLYKKI